MGTNDFLTFAGATGANVITQAAYAALAAQQTGFQAGVSQSAQLNKVWRQSSIMAAVMGQFIADYSGQNAVDDGTTANLETNFKKAINAAGITASQFDNSTSLATTAFLQRQGIQASGVSIVTATSALTLANAGGTAFLTASSATTQTLPALSTFPIGARVEFINAGTGTATIAQNAADSNGFVTNGGARPSSMTLGPGDTLTVEKVDVTGSGVYAWACVIGSAQLGSAAVFGASLSSAGYQKLPSGLIVQWGGITTSAANTFQDFALPIAFPNGPLSLAVSMQAQSQPGTYNAFNAFLLNSTTVRVSGPNAFTFTYVAIGH